MNIFSRENFPDKGELFETILEDFNVRVERIVTVTPDPDTEYDQEQDELVIVMRGSAVVELNGEHRTLNTGDTLFIAAHEKHRVISTERETIWLAVHIRR